MWSIFIRWSIWTLCFIFHFKWTILTFCSLKKHVLKVLNFVQLWKVVSGDDVSVFLLDPARKIVKHFDRQRDGTHQISKSDVQGDYEIYIDNSYSHLTSKIVSLYLLTFHSDALMEKYQKERELNETSHVAMVNICLKFDTIEIAFKFLKRV